MSARSGRIRWQENPFYVLGLPPDASRSDIERTAQKLLAELAIGRDGARTYSTPLGPMERTEERVRMAVAELRDPRKRLSYEIWAETPTSAPPPDDASTTPWAECMRALGFRSLRSG
jgi:hypothetical protein